VKVYVCMYVCMYVCIIIIIIIIIVISGVGLSPLGTAATSGLVYKPQMTDEGDYGAISGMKIGRGNRSTRRKPAPAPLCPPQIPHDHSGSNPDRRGGKPATNRLSYGAALKVYVTWHNSNLETRLRLVVKFTVPTPLLLEEESSVSTV
jgi:hypothetical protein